MSGGHRERALLELQATHSTPATVRSGTKVVRQRLSVEDLLSTVAGGNVTAVKVMLTSIVTALATYQVLLMAVGYGWIRLPFLAPASASTVHRAVGGTIVILTAVVGLACLAVHGFEDSVRAGAPGPDARAGWHSVVSVVLVLVLTLKLLVLHVWRHLERALPTLGISVLALFVATWLTSAGVFL
jgi:hypothetical protein